MYLEPYLDAIEKINNFMNSEDIPTIECFNKKETDELLENILTKIDDYINDNILLMKEPDFHTTLKSAVFEIIEIELEFIFNDTIRENLFELIDYAESFYFDSVNERRSYSDSIIRYVHDKTIIKKKIEDIRSRPQPEQRTDEWYTYRHNLLTASNAWKAFESDSFKNSLIYEKCCPINKDKFSYVNMDSPFHWGHKYEPVSVEIYEDLYKTKVEDFGCLKDSNNTFLGVSPDGINVDDTSDRYGRMLEIKNIVNREINGIPKKEYWVQMQMQMNVCELPECDFLETKFVEYNNYDLFLEDGTFNKTADEKQKGIMICFIKDNMPVYEYCPLNMSKINFEKWEIEMMKKHEHDEWFKTIYWKLETLSCVLVTRNSLWFNAAIPILKRCWEIIEYERENGYEHRAPKKRQFKPPVEEKPKICLINLNTISV